MGSLRIVFLKPMLRCFPSFSDRLEEPTIQTSVSEDTVERFVMSVLPRASGTFQGVAVTTPQIQNVMRRSRGDSRGSRQAGVREMPSGLSAWVTIWVGSIVLQMKTH